MNNYIVTAARLNRRSIVPATLPDAQSIAGSVKRGFTFLADEVDAQDIPNPALGKWYRDADSYYYWGGGIMPVQSADGQTLSVRQLMTATGATPASAHRLLPYVNDSLGQYGLSTPIRQLCFLAQVGHESDGLFYTEELASGQAYEGRKDLGNVQPGDGVRFKGRGLIQITGRSNYQALSKSLGVDLIINPKILGGKNASVCTPDQLKYAALSAGWFWNDRELNSWADQMDASLPVEGDTSHPAPGSNLYFFEKITRNINGGLNGIDHRIRLFNAGLPFFKPQAI